MSLTLDGERTSGNDVRTQNSMVCEVDCYSLAMACMAVANIVKSSLGPVGLDKMLVELDSAIYCVGGQSGRCNNYK